MAVVDPLDVALVDQVEVRHPVEHDVGRLEVPVDEAVVVQVPQGLEAVPGDEAGEVGILAEAAQAGVHELFQVITCDVLLDLLDVVPVFQMGPEVAEFLPRVQARDVRVLVLDVGFVMLFFHFGLRELLHREVVLQFGVPAELDLALGATAQEFQDFEVLQRSHGALLVQNGFVVLVDQLQIL